MDQGDNDWKTAVKAVPELRLLKTLVTGLALVMGLGMVAVVAMLWLRLGQPAAPTLPDSIALPSGADVAAVTFARDWTIVVTEAGEILVFDRAGQLARQLDVLSLSGED